MKTYKRIMKYVVIVENVVLAVSLLLVLVLTFGNVVARRVFQHSLGFTEEITVLLCLTSLQRTGDM